MEGKRHWWIPLPLELAEVIVVVAAVIIARSNSSCETQVGLGRTRIIFIKFFENPFRSRLVRTVLLLLRTISIISIIYFRI